jgi:hypothetical protein
LRLRNFPKSGGVLAQIEAVSCIAQERMDENEIAHFEQRRHFDDGSVNAGKFSVGSGL